MTETYGVDYLIVGQGIGGTVLALTLIRQGQSVMVVDNEPATSSSLVAGGIYNPITGKRLVKTWKAEELFPLLINFYTQAEQLLDVKLLHPNPVYIPFKTVADQNRWHAEADEPKTAGFVKIIPPGRLGYPLRLPELGGLEMNLSGYVDARRLIMAFRKYGHRHEFLKTDTFLYSDLTVDNSGVEWKGVKAKKVIFSEGNRAVDNPFFSFLPFAPTKGELLTVYLPGLNSSHIINTGGLFLIPQGNDLYIAGSTYDRDRLDELPTEAAKKEITDKIFGLLGVVPQVVSHVAGVRPTVKHRRPLVGFHPEFPAVGIFNGLGAKGISLAPYLAAMLVNHMLHQAPLDPEVDISGFYAKKV